MKLLAISAALALLAGCATSSIVVGTQRPPIDPSQVRVYLDPPAKFEKIAMIESSNLGAPAFTAQQGVNKVIERMKAGAAKLGANGLLIQGMGSQSAGSVGSYSGNAYGSGFSGVGISSNIMTKTGAALAIYVESDSGSSAAAPAAPSPATEPCATCKTIGKGL